MNTLKDEVQIDGFVEMKLAVEPLAAGVGPGFRDETSDVGKKGEAPFVGTSASQLLMIRIQRFGMNIERRTKVPEDQRQDIILERRRSYQPMSIDVLSEYCYLFRSSVNDLE